jgi:hypothetical protein
MISVAPRLQVAAGLGDGLQDALAQLLADLRQLLRLETAQVFGTLDSGQQFHAIDPS